jgi:hypothetical protein
VYGGQTKLSKRSNCGEFHNTYKNFTNDGKVSRVDFEDYMEANNGVITET